MGHPVQGMRIVYDAMTQAIDQGNPLSNDTIIHLLENLVDDEKIIENKDRFFKGYRSEDLFRKLYSLLPWVKLITPLGQEQYPKESKEEYQIPDYMLTYEVGERQQTAKVLIEAKLVDADKMSFRLLKNTYGVLNQYAIDNNMHLLFAIFWRKNMYWTVNDISSFCEKNSEYKISFETAVQNDISAIFGDYYYIFLESAFRRTVFSKELDSESKYLYTSTDGYGVAINDELSLDKKNWIVLDRLETPVIDSMFDFKEEILEVTELTTEVIEQFIPKPKPYCIKLSHMLLNYLFKVYLYDKEMYIRENPIVEDCFHIVDTVRRKLGGVRGYQIPHDRKQGIQDLIRTQFGSTHIMKEYDKTPRPKRGNLLVIPHES